MFGGHSFDTRNDTVFAKGSHLACPLDAFFQEAARRRSSQERLERAAQDRAAMLLQVAAAAEARMRKQLLDARVQANEKWVERTKVGKKQSARPSQE